MKKPLISVILPYYKKIRFIFRTLKSIQNQNYKNLELIFVYDDDDKKDLKKIKPYLKKFKKSLIYENKKNKGVSISRNIGIKLAKGKYIAFIDADDVWKPNKLKYQIKQMINCKADFSYTGYNIIDEKNNLKSKRNISSSLNYNDLLKSCEIGLSTVVVKKKFCQKNVFQD